MAKKQRFLQADKTEKIHSSPRQESTFLYFTGKGDNIESGKIGDGESLFLSNTSGLSEVSTVVSFTENVFLKDGYFFWENAAHGDEVSLEVFLPGNTPFPHPTEAGNSIIINGVPQYITASPTPDSTWTGTHVFSPYDITMFRFVNSFSLIGSNNQGLCLESSDAVEIESELSIRFIMKTPETQH